MALIIDLLSKELPKFKRHFKRLYAQILCALVRALQQKTLLLQREWGIIRLEHMRLYKAQSQAGCPFFL